MISKNDDTIPRYEMNAPDVASNGAREGSRASEANGPERQGLPEPRSERGYSNTPDSNPSWNTCIDYLKFRFPKGFDTEREWLNPLLEVLLVDKSMSVERPGVNGYMKKLDFGLGLSLWYGGVITQTKEGFRTSVLELKGQACREFEDRVRQKSCEDGNSSSHEVLEAIRIAWINLIINCLALDASCTRVDLPTDDLSNTISIDELRQKINARQFSTKMRTLELTDSEKAPDNSKALLDAPTIKDNKLSGYTATFGNRDCLQLCIYDKKVEQTLRGNYVPYESWVRYEVRFYHKNADMEIMRLLKALQDGTASEHIASCLATAIEFKENAIRGSHHAGEAKVWSKWETFLQGASKSESFKGTGRIYSVKTNAKWLMKEAAKAIARVSVATEVDVSYLAKLLLAEGSRRISKGDLVAVNQWRRRKGSRPIKTASEFREVAFSSTKMPDEFPLGLTETIVDDDIIEGEI